MSKETKTKAQNGAEKLNYKRTFLIGFGFMACMLMWNIYNSVVPVIFKGKLMQLTDGGKSLPAFLSVALIVNAIMTIDNVFGVIFQPYFGKKSDHTHSKKWGKRMPFIIICLPICAALFALIPVAATIRQTAISIGLMMAVIIFFNFIMSIWRSPVVSLMPDFTPHALQSDANAVINIMGGVGQMIGLVMITITALICGLIGMSSTKEALNAKIDTQGRIIEMVDSTDARVYVAASGKKGADAEKTPLIKYTGILENGVPDEYVDSVKHFIDSGRDKLYLHGDKLSGDEKGGTLVAEKMPALDENGNPKYVNYTPVFLIAAIIAVLCLVVLIAFYRRNKKYDLSDQLANQTETSGDEKPKKIKIRDLPISKEERRSLIIMLISLFLINNASEALVPNFTNFALDTLNMPPANSTLMMAVFAVSLAVFGVPAGTLGRKIGRKKTIIIGLSAIVVMFAIYLAVSQLFMNNPIFVKVVLWIALVVGGAAVGCVNINTLPLVLAIGGREYVGTFTGYYYTATFSAAITGPILCGGLIGLFNEDYNYMFLFCAIFFALGLLVITQVKHGESSDLTDEDIKRAQMADD